MKRIATLFIIECLFFRTLSMMGFTGRMTAIVSIVFISVSSVFVLSWISKLTNKQELLLLYAGYFLRIAVMLMDIYGKNYITILHGGSDSESFYRISVMYYQGNYSEYSTWYPYIVKLIYNFFGQNRVAAQYFNTLFWVLLSVIILSVLKQYKINRNTRLIALLLLAFWPNNICLSSLLMRESMILFFNTFSFILLIRWIQSGKVKYIAGSMGALVPSIILHSGAIGLLMAYVIVIILWSPQRAKLCLSVKSGFVLLLALVVTGVLITVPTFRHLFFAYIPDLTLTNIVNRWFASGGSDYLQNISVNSFGELFIWTPIRMFYFMFSPLPTDWRGISDIVAFLIDSIPNAVIIIVTIIQWRRKHGIERMILGTGLFSLFCSMGIFAWGVSNAGTAMRHRDKLIGIMIVIFCVALNKKKTSRFLCRQEIGEGIQNELSGVRVSS